jgi:filamentous hemagglutinin family protein
MKKNAGSQNARNSVKSGFHLRPKVAALAVAACFSGATLANPTAPTVVHGTASFSQAGNILNVTNSHNAIINWGSFSIGVNELTKFIQPSALSAVLNRVTGQDPSAILGALQSNGRVFLLNPNGIVFGAGSQINVAGLVASTLNMSNADFLAGRMNFTDGAGAGSVVNQGSINASGGPVYMVGNAVTNNGIITSPGGEVVLAAGNSVELVNPGTPNLRVEIQADNNEARNLGSVVADAGRIGIYAGLIKQGGVINANSAVAEGGRIMLKSTKRTDLEAGSVTSARGSSGGEIKVLSDMSQGVVNVAGNLDASSNAVSALGNGGFIDTSAATVNIADSALVTASASNGGIRGKWLIDPTNFSINSGNVTGLVAALNSAGSGTDVDVQTVGNNGGSIFVDTSVTWNSDAHLRLIAHGDVNVLNAISSSGLVAGVKLYAGWNDTFSSGVPNVGYSGIIDIQDSINTGGFIQMVAGAGISQTSAGVLTTPRLLAISNGPVNLTAANNQIGIVAGGSVGQFSLKNVVNLEVGPVGGVNGILVNGASPGLHALVNLDVTGTLTVNQNVQAQGASSGLFAAGGNATTTLASTGAMTINSDVLALGGDGAEGMAGGNATLTLTSGGGMEVNALVKGQGGHGGYTYGGSPAGVGGTSTVTLNNNSSTTMVMINASGNVQSYGEGGGDSYSFDELAGLGGDGKLNITSTGSVVVQGILHAEGGHGGEREGGTAGGGGDAEIKVSALGTGGLQIISGSTIQAYGGQGGTAMPAYYGGGALVNGGGGHALVELTSTNAMDIAGNIYATGGGSPYYSGDSGQDGGNATIRLTSTSSGLSLSSTANVDADGGEGYGSGSKGGNALVELKSSGNLATYGSVVRAIGGYGESDANGGNATIRIKSTGGEVTFAGISEITASGGDTYYMGSSIGGDAVVQVEATGGDVNLGTQGALRAYGGDSGSSQIGGGALVLMSASGNLSLSDNSYAQAFGGDGGYMGSGLEGGAAGVTLLAGGTIAIVDGSEGAAYGGDNAITGGNAAVNVVGGNVSLTNNGNLYAQRGYGSTADGTSSVLVAAVGSISMDNAYVYSSGGFAGLSGSSITLDNDTSVHGDTGVGATASGTLTLDNSSTLSGGGNAIITTGGDVVVSNYSSIFGSPDVIKRVGGKVMMNSGGTIEAGTDTTIRLTFLKRTGTGFFVNGVEGVVYDSITGTGFLANGSPAVLGDSLKVDYLSSSTITVPTETLIVAMNNSTKPPEEQQSTGAMTSEDEKDKNKKKDLPICGK